MVTIRIPACLTSETFEQLEEIWNNKKNVSILLPKNLSDVNAEYLFKFLLSTLPNEFAFCILENIVDTEDIPMSLLVKLFDYEDTGCNVTICLKDNLSQELILKCMLSDDDNVREHFLKKWGKLAK